MTKIDDIIKDVRKYCKPKPKSEENDPAKPRTPEEIRTYKWAMEVRHWF